MLNWEWEKNADIRYITIPKWKKQGVNMLYTSRHAGNSFKPYHSLNMGLHVGDDPASVMENRGNVMKIWGKTIDDMVCCEQVHGNNVAVVDGSHKGRGAAAFDTALAGYDAMVTNTTGVFMTLFYADCVPVYLFDPVERVIALIHSGWKGTSGEIAAKAVASMAVNFQVKPHNIRAFIGPGIGTCCFDISSELAERVKSESASFAVLANDNGQYKWDLVKSNYNLLLLSGLSEQHISTCDICTACNTDLFFSYRKEAGHTGRMAAMIGLE